MTESKITKTSSADFKELNDILDRVKKLPQKACSMCKNVWFDYWIKDGICPDCEPIKKRLKEDDIPERYRKCSFDNFNAYNNELKLALQKSKDFLTNSRGLYLAGKVGSGKTHLAYSILKEIKKLEGTYKYINAAELALELKSNYFSEKNVTGAYAFVKWLVIDDLGASVLNDSFLDLMYRILERRINHGYNKTLIISNLKLSDASGMTTAIDTIDTRIASRISLFEVAYLFDKSTKDMRFELRKK